MPQRIFEGGTYITNLIQLYYYLLWHLYEVQTVMQDELNKDSIILEHEKLNLFTGLRVCSHRLWLT